MTAAEPLSPESIVPVPLAAAGGGGMPPRDPPFPPFPPSGYPPAETRQAVPDEKTNDETVSVAADATDAQAERLALLTPKPPSWEPIEFQGKRYAVVRPQGAIGDQIVARTQQQLVKSVKGKRKDDVEQEFRFASRYREAWAVVACLHVFDPATKSPGKAIFYKGGEETVQELLKQPYEPDGLLNVVGAACVRFMAGKSLTEEEVEEAKND